MKFKFLSVFLIMLAVLLVGCGESKTPVESDGELIEIKNGRPMPGYYYLNNLTAGAADPFILEHNGTYYLYCTGGSRFTVRTSKALNVWEPQEEPILNLADTCWATESGWAPEVYEYNGLFYFIYSAKGSDGLHSIDIAVCNTPNGSFKPLADTPFYAPGYSVIDASLFFDDDGRIYLYYSKDCSTNIINQKYVSQVWGIEVASDFSGTIGEPVMLSEPEQDWEMKSGGTLWNEAPVVFKKNGTYYLLYSANCYAVANYSVGYATSDTPLALYKKGDDACIIKGNGGSITGTGHCNILYSPDGTELYVVYHVHTVPPDTKNGRSLAIDRLIVCEDGTLRTDAPSNTTRALPSGVNGYSHINSGFTYTGSGAKSESDSFSSVKNLFDGIAYGTDKDIYSMGDGGQVEIKLDTPTALTSIMIYPSSDADYIPSSTDVEINGSYIIRDIPFVGTSGAPLTATLSNLPSDVIPETIKITVHTAEGKENAALAEIIMVTARKK